jgi:molybdopterin-guanine dinucleotide biosynthesis protein A
MPEASGVVLAGGQSRRLGVNKALVDLGGSTLIQRVVDRLRQVTDDICVVTDEPAQYAGLARRQRDPGGHVGPYSSVCDSRQDHVGALLAVRFTRDTWPGLGSLAGVYSGLSVAVHERAVVVGCDMPFLNSGLLRYMILLSTEYDLVIPRVGDYYEPLHAVYGKACLPVIEDLVGQGRKRIVDLLGRVRVRYVEQAEIDLLDPQQLSFFNVNTPEDLARAQDLLGKRRRH